MERILLRDRLDKEAAQKRLAAQPNDDFYMSHADFVIRNDGDQAALITQVDQICRVLLRSKQ